MKAQSVMAWLAKQTIMVHLHYPSSVISIVLVSIMCYGGSSYGHGLRYWVGDLVWSIPPYPNFYNDWSSSHLFSVGDSLVFDFETPFYNLMQVTALDYQSCQANNPIKVVDAGPATIILNQQGVFYYLCNLSNYCDLGQKISIIVHDTNFPTAASPSPTPSPAAESPLSPLFAPIISPEPSTDDRNASVTPMPAPVTSRAPSLAPADLGNTTSSCSSRLKSISSCLSVLHLLHCFHLLVLK